MNKQQQWNIWYFIGALLLLMLFQNLWTLGAPSSPSLQPLLQIFERRKTVEATVHRDQITGRLKEPLNGRSLFVTNRVDPALAEQLAKPGITFTGTPENTFLGTILSWIVPVLLFFGIWYFVFRRFAEKQGIGGLINVGKSKAAFWSNAIPA